MATLIKCPSCSFEFPLEEALNDELKEAIEKEKQDLRQKMSEHLKKKEEELQRKEAEWRTQQEKREKDLKSQIETNLRKNITADFERLYGESPGALIGMGIMTDSDNTHTTAQAWYGPLQVLVRSYGCYRYRS